MVFMQSVGVDHGSECDLVHFWFRRRVGRMAQLRLWLTSLIRERQTLPHRVQV